MGHGRRRTTFNELTNWSFTSAALHLAGLRPINQQFRPDLAFLAGSRYVIFLGFKLQPPSSRSVAHIPMPVYAFRGLHAQAVRQPTRQADAILRH